MYFPSNSEYEIYVDAKKGNDSNYVIETKPFKTISVVVDTTSPGYTDHVGNTYIVFA